MSSDFARLGVPSNLVAALSKLSITNPTPIQSATLPDALAGRDVLGRGRTGSGKTFAFLLPAVARLVAAPRRAQAKKPRALVLAPTRELASQIHSSLVPLEQAEGLSSAVVFGGVNQNPQARALNKGVDILIACPGRLLDLMEQRIVDLSDVEITIIDEADHMSDMGFLPVVRRIMRATPANGQRMLFSATLDAGVSKLVNEFLHEPVKHEADSALSPVGTMEHHVLRVQSEQRARVLADLAAAPGNTIIFTRTKHGAKKLAKQLIAQGVPAVDLHGNLSQNARTRNLDAFHSGKVSTLVATDIAARGIHVDDVSLVVHADPPAEHKAYLHRSGRTARAGASGTVITIELPAQQGEVRTLLRQAKITATRAVADHDSVLALAPGERTYLTSDEASERSGANRQQPQQRAPRRSRNGGGNGQQSPSGSRQRRGRSGGSKASAASAPAASSRSAADFSRSFRSR